MKPKEIKLKLGNNLLLFNPVDAEWKPEIKNKETIKAQEKLDKLEGQLKEVNKKLQVAHDDIDEMRQNNSKIKKQSAENDEEFNQLTKEHKSLKATKELV